jgi:hypothetical protein
MSSSTPMDASESRFDANAAPRRPSRWARLRLSDIGILPLIAACPFMYFPKVLEGDTQPWLLIGALAAFLTYRTRRFMLRGDVPLVALALLCVLVYALRGGLTSDLVRAAYTQGTFIMLWLVCRRDDGDLMPAAIRLTVGVWLAVGLYQYVFVALGLPVEIAGRYVEGRGGVPSLTSEPSTYGSLSMLHMMYLLSERNPRNRPYIAATAVSVVLSGSLLAFLLLLFPLMKLKMRWRITAILAIPLLVFIDYLSTSAGINARLESFVSPTAGIAAAVLDPSLNIRLGHIYFTLVANLRQSLLMSSPVDFMNQYNAFVSDMPIFIETGSNFILTAIGDLIYGYGPFGALLLFVFIRKAQSQSATRAKKFEKFAFIVACMLNPIYLSNVFLVMYAQRRN